MPTDAREDVTSTQRLHELLLGYLGCPRVRLWPGADGLTVDEILRSYPEAAAAGQVTFDCGLDEFGSKEGQ